VVLQRESLSKCKGGTVACDGSSAIFHRHQFSSHIKRCNAEHSIEPKPVAASLFYNSFQVQDKFKKDILSKFSNDKVKKNSQYDAKTLQTTTCAALQGAALKNDPTPKM